MIFKKYHNCNRTIEYIGVISLVLVLWISQMFHSKPQSHGRRSVHYCAIPKDTADTDRHCPTLHRPAASVVYEGNTLNIPKLSEQGKT